MPGPMDDSLLLAATDYPAAALKQETLRSAMLQNNLAQQYAGPEAQLKLQQGQQGLQAGNIELQLKQQALRDQQIYGDIMRQNYGGQAPAAGQPGGMPLPGAGRNAAPIIDGNLVGAAAQAGMSGAGLQNLMEQFVKQREALSAAYKNEAEGGHFKVETNNLRLKSMSQDAQAVLNLPQAEQPGAWNRAANLWLQEGYASPGEVDPNNYPGESLLGEYVNRGVDASQQLENKIKQNEEARAAAIAGPTLQTKQAEAEQAQRANAAAKASDAKYPDLAGLSQEQKTTALQAQATLAETQRKNNMENANQMLTRSQEGQRIGIEAGGLNLRQRQFEATVGLPIDANGNPVTPEQQKATAMQDPTAVAIANYQIPPPNARSLTSLGGKALMNRVMALNPTYDGTQFPARNKTALDYSPGGTTGKALTSTDTALAHLNTISQAGDALGNNNIPALNKIAQALGVQVGSSPKTTYDTIVSMVAPEISKAVIGAAGGEAERQQMQGNFSSSASPKQREDAIAAATRLLGARFEKSRQAYESQMQKPMERQLSPESQAVMQRYQSRYQANVAGAGSAPKYKQTATRSDGHKIGSNDGKTWFDVQTGKQVQ